MKMVIVALFVLLITGCAMEKTPNEKCRDKVQEIKNECIARAGQYQEGVCLGRAISGGMSCDRMYPE